MAFRGGRGRGRFGGGQRSYAKEEPFVLYPEIELPSISKISSNDNRNFIMWKSKFESFCKASPYYLGDGTSKYDPFANLDPERYSDKEKPKIKQSLPEFLQPTVAHFPKDILEDSKWKLTKKGKKMQLDADTDLKRFDIFEKLEQKQEAQDEKGENIKKEGEEDAEGEDALSEDEGEYSDNGDYDQNVDFDDDEDDFNMEDDNDDEGTY